MDKIAVKLIETDSKFLENTSHCVYDVNGSNYYYMPFWFKKVSDGVYIEYGFDELPEELKSRLRSLREPKNFPQQPPY